MSSAAVTAHLPFRSYHPPMNMLRDQNVRTTLSSLEAAAATARAGFGCMFATSDEYETAVISERRAQGRYDRPRSRWTTLMFVACTLAVAGAVLLLN